MTEKELRKLNRYQLLEMLVAQTARADELQLRVDALQAQLDDRNLKIETLGSVAEASLLLSGVFESAQKAADDYLRAAKERADMLETAARKRADKIIETAKIQASIIVPDHLTK